MPTKPALTPEQELWVCERYRAGESSLELGREFHCHASSIRRVLRNHDVPRRVKAKGRKRVIKHDAEYQQTNAFIASFYLRGWSVRSLAEMLDLSHNTVTYRLKKLGIKRRTLRESQLAYRQRLEATGQSHYKQDNQQHDENASANEYLADKAKDEQDN